MTPADGVRPRFVFVGGRPSLDLVATLGKRHREPVERVPHPADLARWLVAAGLLPVEPPVSGEQLGAAHRLREAINVLVRSRLDGAGPGLTAVELVNETARRPDVPIRLELRDGVALTRPCSGDTDAALAAVARDAVRLLGGPVAARIKQCGHPDCSLVFVDDTQSGRRRWCSMDRCGNLVKVAGYRARRALS